MMLRTCARRTTSSRGGTRSPLFCWCPNSRGFCFGSPTELTAAAPVVEATTAAPVVATSSAAASAAASTSPSPAVAQVRWHVCRLAPVWRSDVPGMWFKRGEDDVKANFVFVRVQPRNARLCISGELRTPREERFRRRHRCRRRRRHYRSHRHCLLHRGTLPAEEGGHCCRRPSSYLDL